MIKKFINDQQAIKITKLIIQQTDTNNIFNCLRSNYKLDFQVIDTNSGSLWYNIDNNIINLVFSKLSYSIIDEDDRIDLDIEIAYNHFFHKVFIKKNYQINTSYLYFAGIDTY